MKNMAAAPIRNTKKKKTTWKWFQNNPKYIPEKKNAHKNRNGCETRCISQIDSTTKGTLS